MKNPIKFVRIFIFCFGLIFFCVGAGIYYNAYATNALENSVGDEGLLPFIFMMIGLLEMSVAGIWTLVVRKKEQKEKWLFENGTLLKAKFSSVEKNMFITVNNKHPFNIYCQWMDPLTNQAHTFKSKSIWIDPNPFIDQSRPIQVYVDPANFKSYVVDLSFLPA